MRQDTTLQHLITMLLVFGIVASHVTPLAAAENPRLATLTTLPKRFADGFDYPVGNAGDAVGYYTARSMVPYHHMGDDWNGNGGGNSDLGDPIFAIADGLVVYSYDYGSDWGEVIIIRHKYKDARGRIDYVDSFYGHVQNRRVRKGQNVKRGQRIAEIGNNNGMYVAHLHLEIRKNIDIGIQTWRHAKSAANYLVPKKFIAQNRPGSSRRDLMIAKNSSGADASTSRMPGYDRSLRALMDRNKAAEAGKTMVASNTKRDKPRGGLFSKREKEPVIENLSKPVPKVESEPVMAVAEISKKDMPNRMRVSREPSRKQSNDSYVTEDTSSRKDRSDKDDSDDKSKGGLFAGLLSKNGSDDSKNVNARKQKNEVANNTGRPMRRESASVSMRGNRLRR